MLAEVPTRSEFLLMPAWQKIAFYVMIAAATALFLWQVLDRVKVWRQGKPIDWSPDYFGGIWRYVLGQRKVRTSRPKSGAPMHVLIFYGFLTLFIGTTLLGINTYSPWKFHQGNYYLTYEFVLDVMGLALFIGLTWALVRRWLFKPAGTTSDQGDIWTLVLLLTITATGFLVEAGRMSLVPAAFNSSAPVGNLLSSAMPEVSVSAYHTVWWFHALLVAVFIAIVPRLRLRHIAYAILSAAGYDKHAPMGALRKLPMSEVEETGKIGVEQTRDYSRWHLMSLDACMECGRCTEVCPAWLAGKPLNPKQVVQDIRNADSEATVADAIGEEALWACTTCNACVEACPVLIRHVDLIVDARRFLVAEGRLAGTGATMLRQLQSSESAWGTQSDDREKWMADREIPLVRDLVANGEQFDVLFWVGCAGAIDKAATKTVQEFAALLQTAGVRFACLGKEERCTGDPARRVGDEFLFQQFAETNVATFEQYGVKTIVTTCPHCFNTIKNEYPAFEGEYEVLHHAQYLERLIDEGKLKPAKLDSESVTLHDPCYLARVNNVADAPRRALGVESNLDDFPTPVARYLYTEPVKDSALVEPAAFGNKTLCCGAGGGRMWMDEEPDQRPSSRRVDQLLETGAQKIAVACPFCRIMIDAGLQQAAPERDVELVDIVELVSEANE